MDTGKQNKIIRMIKLMEEYGGAQSGGILRLIDGVETALDEADKLQKKMVKDIRMKRCSLI